MKASPLKSLVMLTLGAAAVVGCDGESTSSDGPSLESVSKSDRELWFSDSFGDDVSVDFTDKNVMIVGLATWCPYSTTFVQCVNSAAFSEYRDDLEFVFVFGDEWPTIAAMLQEDRGLSKSEAEAQAREIQAEHGGSPLIEPGFLDLLPAGRVVFTSKKTKNSPNTFPVTVSQDNGKFGSHPVEWLTSWNTSAARSFAAQWKDLEP